MHLPKAWKNVPGEIQSFLLLPKWHFLAYSVLRGSIAPLIELAHSLLIAVLGETANPFRSTHVRPVPRFDCKLAAAHGSDLEFA